MRPTRVPIGLQLTRTSRKVGRAFDAALSQAGGSLPMWLVLVNLKINPRASQRELAEALGVSEATVTHHLNAMETDGLLSRRRDPVNRRVHIVDMSDAGDKLFSQLRNAAVTFDAQLRTGLDDGEIAHLEALLGRLATNVGARADQPSWAGLADVRSDPSASPDSGD